MIYSGIVEAKSAHKIPVFKSGKLAHSKYNPIADKISIDASFFGCIIVFGIAAGFHIKNLLSNKSIIKIICIEADTESLKFCKEFEIVKELEKDERIVFCTIENNDCINCIKNNYIPILHKKLLSVYLRSWHDEIPNVEETINKILTTTLESISNDISVQVHFGKHWHRNILSNLLFIDENNFNNTLPIIKKEKNKAAIIAAGPTLDSSINVIQKNRNALYIISTDTAYKTLLSHKIVPDAVISVDAQQVSSEHFFDIKKTETTFIFDISSNPETIKNIFNKGNKVFFIRSNHPLSSLIQNEIFIPFIESGSGTVTIAAADFARQSGFTEIEFFGADFAYSDGKPYCKGTYLEKKFNSNSKRISSSENLYTSLMFRTELQKTSKEFLCQLGKDPVTSSVLISYKKSLLEWAKNYKMIQHKNTFISNQKNKNFPQIEMKKFKFSNFMNNYIKQVQTLANKMDSLSLYEIITKIQNSKELISLLPLFASLKKEKITEDISLALQFLLYYNSIYENQKK